VKYTETRQSLLWA